MAVSKALKPSRALAIYNVKVEDDRTLISVWKAEEEAK